MKRHWLIGIMVLGATPIVLGQAPDIPKSIYPEAKQQEKPEAQAPGPAQWWNVEGVVGRLQLTESQRSQMDQLWDTQQKVREAADKARRSLNQRLSKAFAEGDLEAATALVGKLETSLPDTENNRIKLQILSALDATQLQALGDSYPRVLEKPWRRNTQRLLTQEGKARGARRNKKAKAEGAEAEEKNRNSRKVQEN